MQDLLFKEQIDFILSLGEGVKVCLFDDETKEYVSNLISFSQFQEHDFFYFNYITNKSRIAINNVYCIVIIQPKNLKCLVEELSDPFYGKYIILFTNQIDPFVLEIIANADSKCLVSEIYEIYLDVLKECDFLYIIKGEKNKKLLDGISSLIIALEIDPVVQFLNTSDSKNTVITESKFYNLGIDLINRLKQYNFKSKGTVVLLKRSFDVITPLVYDWHYQSLINDHLGLKNGLVTVNEKDYFLNDLFYNENKFQDIHYVGNQIKTELKELEKNKIKITNYEFEDIEEKAIQSMIVETHLKIYDMLIEECMKNKKFSEAQMTLIKELKINNSLVTIDNLKMLIEDFDESKQLILILIYFIKNVNNWENESQKFKKFSTQLLKFYNEFHPFNWPYKPKFCNNKDIKLSYEPPIKRLVRHLILNKIKSGLLTSINKDCSHSGPLVIYIEGGITITEYREAILEAAKFDCTLYLVSNCLLNSKSILKRIA